MSAFAEKWGRALEGRGYTQFSNLLLRRWREIGLSRTERDNILIIISYQDNHETIPSAKQLAYESGVCYETTRKNLRNLTAYKKDGGLGLLIPVLLKQGRIRYNMMPLRRELEKLNQQPLEIVKPAPVRPSPKPSPIVTIVPPDPDAWVQKEWAEIDEDAVADWNEIKQCISEKISKNAFDNWIDPIKQARYNGDTLYIIPPDTSHRQQAEGPYRELIRQCSRLLYRGISVACLPLGGG